MDGAAVATGQTVQPHRDAARRRARRPLPRARPPAGRGAAAVGDRRGGRDVRALSERLGLDSGYLSRLLRSLEGARLVVVEPGAADRRVRTARLTAAGRAERALARPPQRRPRGVAARTAERRAARPAGRAMGEVERLLTAAMVEIAAVDPVDRRRAALRARLRGGARRRFDGGFDPGRAGPVRDEELRPPAGVLLLATLQSEPVGCGSCASTTAGRRRSSACGCSSDVRGLGVGAGSGRARGARRRARSRSSAWTRTGRCARRSPCTASTGVEGDRRRTTTTPTRTTGSRSGSAA